MSRFYCAIALYAAAALAEAHVLLLLLDPAAPAWQPIISHACAIVLLAGWLSLLRFYGMQSRAAALFFVSTAALGPIGYLGAVFAMFICRVSRRISTRKLDQYYAWLAGDAQSDVVAELYKNLVLGRERPGRHLANVKIIDVLRWGTLDEKHKMVATLGRSFRPELAPSLRFALTSTDATIRIQAATLVAKIENDFTQRWLALPGGTEKRPTEPEHYLALAKHLDEHAHTGMLDDLRERAIRKEASELFRAYLAVNDGDEEARISLGRLLTRLGEYGDALTCLEPLVDDERALSWYCQSLYGLERFDQLRRLLQQPSELRPGLPPAGKFTGVQQLWSGAMLPSVLVSAQGSSSS